MMSRLRAGWLLRQGQRALFQGNLHVARDSLEQAMKAQPRWVFPHLWLASLWSEDDELEKARSQLAIARKLSSNSTVVQLWLGLILIDHQEYEEAVEILEEADNSSENLHVPGYLALARWCAAGHEEPLDDVNWKIPVGSCELHGRWLLEIEDRFPGGPGTDYMLGAESPRLPWHKFARWRAERLRNRARRELAKKRFEKAFKALERADTLWSGSLEAQELRVHAHFGATPARLEKIKHKAHDVDLRLAAAEGLMEIGAPREARALLEPAKDHIRSIDANNLNWTATHALLQGRLLLVHGTYSAAIEYLELARELWSVDVEPLYYLGIAHLCAGSRSLARKSLIAGCALDGELASLRLREYRAAVVG